MTHKARRRCPVLTRKRMRLLKLEMSGMARLLCHSFLISGKPRGNCGPCQEPGSRKTESYARFGPGRVLSSLTSIGTPLHDPDCTLLKRTFQRVQDPHQ